MMDEFMEAVAKRWPRCLVQFEDFRCVGTRPPCCTRSLAAM